MSAAKYIKALKEAASYENLKTQQMTAFEQRAITKLLYAVIKNAPHKSYFKSLVCYEELGGITEIDNEMLDKIYNFYLFDMTYNLFNTDGFADYKERVCAS